MKNIGKKNLYSFNYHTEQRKTYFQLEEWQRNKKEMFFNKEN